MRKLDMSTASNASAFCYQSAIVYLPGRKVGQVTTHAQRLLVSIEFQYRFSTETNRIFR